MCNYASNMNTNFFKKLDTDTLEKISNAQVDDLIERRNVKDPGLFRQCYINALPEDTEDWEDIVNFSDIAGEAFNEYHKRRAAERAKAAADAVPVDDDEPEDDDMDEDEESDEEPEDE